MDARSVMEQRLQAMVCCFSMVQRVLARQPQDDSTVVSVTTSTSSSICTSSSGTNSGCTTQSESSKKTDTSINTPYNTDCSTNNHSSSSSSSSSGSSSSGNSNSTLPECEQGFEGKLPTRTVSAAEATERIWKYLSAVPSLMEVRIVYLVCSRLLMYSCMCRC
jgi:hypothetical protein